MVFCRNLYFLQPVESTKLGFLKLVHTFEVHFEVHFKVFFSGPILLNFYAMLKRFETDPYTFGIQILPKCPEHFFSHFVKTILLTKYYCLLFPEMVCEDDFITRPTLICASLFEKLEYPDACKDKTEMIFLIFFIVSFWYQIGIKKIIKIPNEYGIQASKRTFFKAKMRSDHGSC